MEVSSHALDQGRTRDCPFRVAVFTNFSRDHLDYHASMETYFNAKSRLFQDLHKGKGGEKSVAVVNMDDARGKALLSFIRTKVTTYGLGRQCDVRAEGVSADRSGLKFVLMTPAGDSEIESSLIGKVNVYNILAAAAAALSLDIDLDAISRGIQSLPAVPGRLELVKNPKGLAVVVDYAHTPDALLKAQETLGPLVDGRLITVFGCGGDRDKGKRSEMGLVAGKNSDILIITSDNPRSEDPESIVRQIEEGIKESGQKKREWGKGFRSMKSGYFIEVDRREAIKKAVSMASKDDMILIAGKGHEDYQIVGSERRFFDDRREVLSATG
jgi:UDP-N-acetylmuramoyl-L-alanyl-D-glutamate--2,6-diaminopimelate ligase